ncbi:uncharacterized protein LOC118532358 isoform X1 [Halichoerus grypus]|uniref:uncharacterized protein LOC118532358 isoform X1 n=1 Tax=Halichoerus grypus TaxID=9711 RepID=UPI0016596152|nr:uncharacterized protein LOC118532358 isoform X1 [Halichoerus grypus]
MAAAALDLRKWHWPREPTKAIWIQRLLLLVIVLICGFILNKVLVFSVLFISLRKAWAQVKEPPEVSPGHSKSREADLTFQEQMGMPSSTNKYHVPLCSVPPSLPLAVVSDTPGLEQWTGRGKKQGRSHLSLLL